MVPNCQNITGIEKIQIKSWIRVISIVQSIVWNEFWTYGGCFFTTIIKNKNK